MDPLRDAVESADSEPSGEWHPTHLQKMYELWGEVQGSMRVARSDDANIQVQLFAVDEVVDKISSFEGDSAGITLFLAINNLRNTSLETQVRLAMIIDRCMEPAFAGVFVG